MRLRVCSTSVFAWGKILLECMIQYIKYNMAKFARLARCWIWVTCNLKGQINLIDVLWFNLFKTVLVARRWELINFSSELVMVVDDIWQELSPWVCFKFGWVNILSWSTYFVIRTKFVHFSYERPDYILCFADLWKAQTVAMPALFCKTSFYELNEVTHPIETVSRADILVE